MTVRTAAFPAMILAVVVGLAPHAIAQEIRAGEVLAADDFERFGEATAALGRLPTGGQSWAKHITAAGGEAMPDLVRGTNDVLWIGYSSGNVNAPGVWVDGLRVADGIIELTVGRSTMDGRAHTAIISYRAPDGPAAASAGGDGAYHLWLAQDWSGSRDVVLRYGSQRLAAGNVADTHDVEGSYRVRIAFAGSHHRVWVDDQRLIDFWEWHPGRDDEGLVGFGAYYSQGLFDDFRLSAVAAGADEPTYDTSTGRIPPLIYQGRPFFPLGTYDLPREEDVEEFVEAGGNCVIVPCFRESEPPQQRLADLREKARWGAEHGVAMVYYPLIDFFSRVGEQAIPTRPEEIPPKIELIEEMLSVTADHPNTLGYWTFDEPENQTWEAYKQWEERRDVGLAQWLAEGMGWTYEAFKQRDPDAYVMPTIAWWTTYEGLAPLYDVNVPNTYQEGEEIYQVVYDALRAADAIRATDARSFVFMPAVYDTAEWPNHSRPEMRYSFIAPVTRGAMGILGWRLGRASMPYRRAVIYPVMREVRRLMPWLLGEWHDEKVTSDRDTATADYLKELPERVRLVPGEEEAGLVEVAEDAVPDCSHCLRRAPDNTWLLIAASNRREPMEVTFTLDGIEGLPEIALEMIDWREVAVTAGPSPEVGTITDRFEPFVVRAYRIVPE
ncbi:MAG: hypothetical protein U9R79_20735 [Armatimonadota bacterium]|nr:hypothetical protein [Armatimonadota bacterium]